MHFNNQWVENNLTNICIFCTNICIFCTDICFLPHGTMLAALLRMSNTDVQYGCSQMLDGLVSSYAKNRLGWNFLSGTNTLAYL